MPGDTGERHGVGAEEFQVVRRGVELRRNHRRGRQAQDGIRLREGLHARLYAMPHFLRGVNLGRGDCSRHGEAFTDSGAEVRIVFGDPGPISGRDLATLKHAERVPPDLQRVVARNLDVLGARQHIRCCVDHLFQCARNRRFGMCEGVFQDQHAFRRARRNRAVEKDPADITEQFRVVGKPARCIK